MIKMSCFLILVLGASLIFTGCSETKTVNLSVPDELLETNTLPKKPSDLNHEIVASDLLGSVKVENLGEDSIVTYTFKNQSKKTVTVIGGARYKLLKDDKIVKEGSVPIKDFIDLEPGEEYADEKTFANLEAGTYGLQVEWNNTMAATNFIRN
jgi:hypothetical protein